MNEEKNSNVIKVVITVDDSDLIRAKNNAAEFLEILTSIGNSSSGNH